MIIIKESELLEEIELLEDMLNDANNRIIELEEILHNISFAIWLYRFRWFFTL